MMSDMPCDTSRLRLSEGQTTRIALNAGDTLSVTEGAVRIRRGPRWLAECMVWLEIAYSCGSTYVVEESEDVFVIAESSVCVLMLRQQPPSVLQVVVRRMAYYSRLLLNLRPKVQP